MKKQTNKAPHPAAAAKMLADLKPVKKAKASEKKTLVEVEKPIAPSKKTKAKLEQADKIDRVAEQKEAERAAAVSKELAAAGIVEVGKADQEKILGIIKKHQPILLVQLARALNLPLDRATEVIKILRQRGLVKTEGHGAMARWVVAPPIRSSVTSTPASKVPSGERSAMAKANGVEPEDLALLEAAESAVKRKPGKKSKTKAPTSKKRRPSSDEGEAEL